MVRIEKGFDFFKGINLYRLVGVDNDFVGEWTTNIKDCYKEAKNENLTIAKDDK